MADEATNAAPEGGAEGAPAEGEGAPAPKKKKMMLIVSSAVAVVGILVAVGVVFFMGGDKKEAAGQEEATKMDAVAIYDVPEFNLSLLSDDPNAQHFVKMKMSLELAKQADVPSMDKLLPRLQDDWGSFLRQMRVSDMQGSANLQRLKEGLLRRANQSMEPIGIKAVYIKELLVQ